MSFQPSINDLLSMCKPVSVHPSPDASKVAYILTNTDFNHNVYFTECFIYDKVTKTCSQLTRKSSVSNIK